MNFSNTPKRSSADDELDQVLNAWAHRQSDSAEESPRGAQFKSTSDALEFHRWADDTLRSEPAAKGPAVGTWNRVLHHVEQKSPRGIAGMSASTAESGAYVTPRYGYQSGNRKEMTLSRFANIAATVAIVFAVSVGGWFAMSQLPPGGDGRFGVFQASPEVAQSGTCEVAPLTVDEVMAIVENPYRYMNNLALPQLAEANSYSAVAENELMIARVDPSWETFNSVNRARPSQEVFDEAQVAANVYIVCSDGATTGQYLALMHPFWVQEMILSSFPVYGDEASIRAYVEEIIDQPMSTAEGYYRLTGYCQEGNIVANPDIEKSEQILYSTAFDEPVVAMGVLITDENGDVVLETGSSGYPHQRQSGTLTSNPIVVVQKSEITGRWYVLPYFGD